MDKFARALKRFQIPVLLDVAERAQGAVHIRRIVVPAKKPKAPVPVAFHQFVYLPLHVLRHRVHLNTMLPRPVPKRNRLAFARRGPNGAKCAGLSLSVKETSMDSSLSSTTELLLRAFRARTAVPGFDIPRLSMWHRSLLCG